MKKSILFLAVAILSLQSIYAGTGADASIRKDGKEWLFRPLASSDVSLEVERIGGEVMVHLYSQNMRNVDVIYVEKSSDPTSGFTRCQSVKVADFLIKSKNYIEVSDANPTSANLDSYYRIRTISTKGETKTYAPVDLAPLYQVDPLEVVEK